MSINKNAPRIAISYVSILSLEGKVYIIEEKQKKKIQKTE